MFGRKKPAKREYDNPRAYLAAEVDGFLVEFEEPQTMGAAIALASAIAKRRH